MQIRNSALLFLLLSLCLLRPQEKLFALATAPFSCGGQTTLYSYNYSYNVITGTRAQVGNIIPGTFNSLVYNLLDNYIYASAQRNKSSLANHIYHNKLQVHKHVEEIGQCPNTGFKGQVIRLHHSLFLPLAAFPFSFFGANFHAAPHNPHNQSLFTYPAMSRP